MADEQSWGSWIGDTVSGVTDAVDSIADSYFRIRSARNENPDGMSAYEQWQSLYGVSRDQQTGAEPVTPYQAMVWRRQMAEGANGDSGSGLSQPAMILLGLAAVAAIVLVR